jgi:hypothetical protein
MNKIKALLEKAGCSPELVGGICEALETYKSSLRSMYDTEYKNRVEKAKKVCIDETESHKRELARRVQIFCETKAAAIEAQLAKQSALRESEAAVRLKGIVNLLEGIEPSAAQNGQSTAVVEKARRKMQQANEDKLKAIEVANRQTAIAEKVLKQNRKLATENAKLKKSIQEGTSVVAEGKAPVAQPKRIDAQRSVSAPVTSRPTILENQDRRPPRSNTTNVRSDVPAGRFGFGVNDIAANMDDDLI